MSIYSELKDYIDNRRNSYSNDIDLITSFYRGELGTSEAYNGRQLLELLQNADDARSKDVQIKLDTKDCLLEICNLGNEFSLEGIKSIMLANKSPKSNDKNYIGNKGLGFRSILNWANEIHIITKDIELKFSPQIAWNEFHSIVKDPTTRDRLLKERDIEEGIAPFPVLGIPELFQNSLKEFKWATSIKVIYNRRFEKDIKEQIDDLRPEILLFLNHIKNIEIIEDNIPTILTAIEEIRNGKTFRKVNEQEWQIEDSKDQPIPGTNKLYRFKVAYKAGLTDNFNRLFTYFPTRVPIHLPCLIHATFDLDPSRNYLTKTEYNKYILKELATFLGKIAIASKESPANWHTYRLLQPLGKETNELLNEFYSELDEIRNSSEIFPCVDGKYRFLDEIVFYTSEFSGWIKDIGKEQYLPELLLNADNKGILEQSAFKNKKYDPRILKKKIDDLSAQLACIQERVDLIDILLDKSFEPYPLDRFSLLVNKDLRLIPSSSIAFTPAIELENEFHKPAFVQLDLMHQDLYTMLVTQHKAKFPKVEQQESREFRSYFSKILNVQPYDSNNVINKIISGTKEQLNKVMGQQNQANVVVEMVQCLFKNFLLLKNKEERFSDACLLISKTGAIKESSSLWLNSSFPSGVLTEEIYNGVLSPQNYVADPSIYKLGVDDNHLLESFFIWLGVNKYAKLKKLDFIAQEWEGNDYIEFCYNKAPWTQEVSRYYFSGLIIDEIDTTIKKLSAEKLLLLVLKEEKLRKRLERENDDDLKSQYGNKYTTIFNKPSYINFQLESIGHFSDYLAEDDGIPYLNTSSFNINDPIFKRYHIKDEDIRYVLYRLGAKSSFSDLDYTAVYQLIKDCGHNTWKEEYARRLYQLCFNYFKANTSISYENIEKEFSVLTRQGDNVTYRPVTEVFYSDNKVLPQKILNQYWIFEFPKRNGEEQMSRFFGVRNFKEVEFKIDQSEQKGDPLQREFNEWIAKIKPFILTYRLQTLQKFDEKRNNANSLKRCSIQLVSSLVYQIEEKAKENLGLDEFIIKDKDQFIICAGERVSLDELRRSPKFCDTIAEIFCILFKVNDGKNSYRSIFKDSIAETKHLIHEDSLLDQLQQAEALLGISRFELNFWKAVAASLTVKYEEGLSSDEEFKKSVIAKLPLKIEGATVINYEIFDNQESFDALKQLSERGISLEYLNEHCPGFPALQYWHRDKFKHISLDIEVIWSKAWWVYFSGKEHTEQKQFNSVRRDYSNAVTKAIEHLANENRYVFFLNYRELLLQSLAAQHQFQIAENDLENVTIDNLYNDLLDQYNFSISQLPDDIQSLLFFHGNEVFLSKALEELRREENSKDNSSDEIDMNLDQVSIIPVSIKKGNLAGSHLKPSKKGKKGGTHSDKSDKQKKKAGRKAEKLVRDKLAQLYPQGEVFWISGNSDENKVPLDDSKGYDIRYKKHSDDLEWIYLEVKSFSGGSFIISLNEVKVGIDNRDQYQLALVEGTDIFLIDDFFQNEERVEEFDSLCSKASIKPLDFEVFIDLSYIEEGEKAKRETILREAI